MQGVSNTVTDVVELLVGQLSSHLGTQLSWTPFPIFGEFLTSESVPLQERSQKWAFPASLEQSTGLRSVQIVEPVSVFSQETSDAREQMSKGVHSDQEKSRAIQHPEVDMAETGGNSQCAVSLLGDVASVQVWMLVGTLWG